MRYLAVIFVLSIFLSCDRPECVSTNKIFQKYPVSSPEYKRELARLMEAGDHDRLRFWFDKYVSNKEGEFILVNVQGDNICASAFLKVENWAGIENIKDRKGMSYSGTQLSGLKYHVVMDSSNITLVYDSVERIID